MGEVRLLGVYKGSKLLYRKSPGKTGKDFVWYIAECSNALEVMMRWDKLCKIFFPEYVPDGGVVSLPTRFRQKKRIRGHVRIPMVFDYSFWLLPENPVELAGEIYADSKGLFNFLRKPGSDDLDPVEEVWLQRDIWPYDGLGELHFQRRVAKNDYVEILSGTWKGSIGRVSDAYEGMVVINLVYESIKFTTTVKREDVRRVVDVRRIWKKSGIVLSRSCQSADLRSIGEGIPGYNELLSELPKEDAKGLAASKGKKTSKIKE